jgi:hypothetical protein
VNKQALLLLIGDETGDRRFCDFYTLKVLMRLKDANVPVEIMLSNHGAEFVKAYETQDRFTASLMQDQQFSQSLSNTQVLIDKGYVSKEEVMRLIDQCYKPCLKALSYSLSEDQNSITIYSHAGIGIKNIEYLANKLNVPFRKENPVALAQTIDEINAVFTEEYVNKNKVHILLNPEQMMKGFCGEPIDQKEWPLVHMIWNRTYDDLDRPAWAFFVHGHDMGEKTHDNVFVIDNLLGKANTMHRGIYNILYSHERNLEKKQVAKSQPETLILYSQKMQPLINHQPMCLDKEMKDVLQDVTKNAAIEF